MIARRVDEAGLRHEQAVRAGRQIAQHESSVRAGEKLDFRRQIGKWTAIEIEMHQRTAHGLSGQRIDRAALKRGAARHGLRRAHRRGGERDGHEHEDAAHDSSARAPKVDDFVLAVDERERPAQGGRSHGPNSTPYLPAAAGRNVRKAP